MLIFDREYVVRRGLRSDFVVVVVDHLDKVPRIASNRVMDL